MDYLPPKRTPEPTEAEFRVFLQVLAAEEVAAWTIYENLRWKLIGYFERRKLSPAADLSDEILNRVVNKVNAGVHIEDINRYVYGVARFLRLEIYKQPLALAIFEGDGDRDAMRGGLNANRLAAPEGLEDARANCLDECLERQPADKLDLLLDYYEIDERHKTHYDKRLRLATKYSEREKNVENALAGNANLTTKQKEEKLLTTLYKAVSRIRAKVADCARDCHARELQKQANPVRK